jgi:Na+-transporting methylmalonyl-CoA/oxaloacetate decarboxylase gamma subunit
VREGHELEIQRYIGIAIVVVVLAALIALVYGISTVVDRVN